MLPAGFFLFFIAGILLILMDVTRKINLLRPAFFTVLLLPATNFVLASYFLHNQLLASAGVLLRTMYFSAAILFLTYYWGRLAVFPLMDGKKIALRLKIMAGGRILVYRSLWGIILCAAVLSASWNFLLQKGVPSNILVSNAICAGALLLLLLGNAVLRIFFTSRRLSILRRVLMLLTAWVPGVNLLVLLYSCRIVRDEYDFALYKENIHLTRVESDLCKTRYPLVMVHGVLFRDLRYFNYWGRIPRELIRYGATVFYGNQEAVGTIEQNGYDLRNKIMEIMAQTGCEKVNIIAHSKGGLDARYVISALGMSEYVASLTTMNTPHRGCRFIDKACKLPEGLFRLISRVVNSIFRRLGDKNPDFYSTIHQFATPASEEFNRCVPDMPGIYYQSYASKMKHMGSDSLLSLPYLMIRPLEGDNDGLVSVSSAMWGNYRGALQNKNRRGISHGDIIDLKREDYRGFDVVETYISIVSDLKTYGF